MVAILALAITAKVRKMLIEDNKGFLLMTFLVMKTLIFTLTVADVSFVSSSSFSSYFTVLSVVTSCYIKYKVKSLETVNGFNKILDFVRFLPYTSTS